MDFKFLTTISVLCSFVLIILNSNSNSNSNYNVLVEESVIDDVHTKKYQWFKKSSQEIINQDQKIKEFEHNILIMETKNKENPINEWDSLDQIFWDRWNDKVDVMKENYNRLAHEYNEKTIESNWEFRETDKIPPYFQLKYVRLEIPSKR